MQREVRRVRPDWQHPKEPNYRRFNQLEFVPLHAQSYRAAADEWMAELAAFKPSEDARYPWEEIGSPPDENRMPDWSDEERTAFQIYETVSEGTPVSPVFETREAMIAWLMQPPHSDREYQSHPHCIPMQGLSREAAEQFADHGGLHGTIMRFEPDGTRHTLTAEEQLQEQIARAPK